MFSIGKLEKDRSESLDDTPAVVHVEIHRRSKLIRLVVVCGQNHMIAAVLLDLAGNESHFDTIGTSKHRLRSPLGKLVGIVLDLIRHRTSLALVELPAPVGEPRVKLIQTLDKNRLVAAVRVLEISVNLVTQHKKRVVAKVPLLVHVSNALVLLGLGNFAVLELAISGRLGHGVVLPEHTALGGLLHVLKALCKQILVCLVGFERKGKVDLGLGPLVKIELVALLVDDDVPRDHRAACAHELRKHLDCADHDLLLRVLGGNLAHHRRHARVLRGRGPKLELEVALWKHCAVELALGLCGHSVDVLIVESKLACAHQISHKCRLKVELCHLLERDRCVQLPLRLDCDAPVLGLKRGSVRIRAPVDPECVAATAGLVASLVLLGALGPSGRCRCRGAFQCAHNKRLLRIEFGRTLNRARGINNTEVFFVLDINRSKCIRPDRCIALFPCLAGLLRGVFSGLLADCGDFRSSSNRRGFGKRRKRKRSEKRRRRRRRTPETHGW
eukprot:comp20205_c0_seq1/m.39996 comp20205_c0_seq1/g.39996  ORF comp20205_c0_seq1/g.39996 comp20205_c0_seq1/m.39996 type:complete len:500 (+) comp20205_c0_seq1:79-1578(+)